MSAHTHRRFDPVDRLFADLCRCRPRSSALMQLGVEHRVLFGRATWWDGRVRWRQLLCVPSERADESPVAWMRGAASNDDEDASLVLVVCTPRVGRRVLMACAQIVDCDLDGAQDDAEGLMLESIPLLVARHLWVCT